MKKLLCVTLMLATVLTLFAGCAQIRNSYNKAKAEELILKGELQAAYDLLCNLENPTEEEEIIRSGFRYQLTEISDDNGRKTTHTYDEKGNLLKAEQLRFGKYDRITTIYTYDKKSNILTKEHMEYFNEIPIRSECYYSEYFYDENGILQAEDRYDTDRLSKSSLTCKYDENGRLVSKFREDYPADAYTYTYDDKGNLICEECSWFSSYQEWYKIDYTYDENGKLCAYEKNYSTPYNTTDWEKVSYTYDINGNIETKQVNNSYSLTTSTYTYQLIYIPVTQQ